MSEKKEITDQDRIRDLHDCNSNLRDATINIQKSIGGIIDRMTNNEVK